MRLVALTGVFLLFPISLFSQYSLAPAGGKTVAPPDSTVSQELPPSSINQIDEKGRKQGYWAYLGKDKPRGGYSESDTVESGHYRDNRKHGYWTFYYPDNRKKATLEYKYNRPNGPYVKYSEKTGLPMEEGTWKGNKYIGLYTQYFESGCPELKKFFNNAGKAEYTVFYRDSCAHLPYSETITDSIAYDRSQDLPAGFSEVSRGGWHDHRAVKFEYVDEVDSSSLGDPDSIPDGYRKVYNDNNDLWIDGEFKGGRLWHGKKYLYDKNGLVFKVQIYKKGQYIGDGVVEF